MAKTLDRLGYTKATLGVAVLVFGGLGVIATAPAAMAAEPAAAAQPVGEPRRNTIENVIVTARMVEENAQDVPVAITAIAAELQSSTIRNLTDLEGFAPNVTLTADGSRGGGGANIGIRGVSPTRTDDNSFDVPIGVMIDDIYLGTIAGQVIENFDLERVEILRGPQGTLFGKNTVGGVVRVFRSRPTGEWDARVKGTLGDNNQQELRIVANAPIIDDMLAIKVYGTTQQADGPLDNVTIGGQSADRDYENYGATLLYTPNDNFEALFTIERFDDQSDLQAFQTNASFAPGVEPSIPGGILTCLLYGAAIPGVCRTSTSIPGVSENNTRNEAKLVTDAYTLNMSFDLNENMQLVSITGYRDQSEDRIYDFDGSAAPWITIERWNDYHQTTQEFRIDGQWDDLKMTTGVYFFNNKFTQDWVTGGQFWGILQSGPFGIPPVSVNQAAWDVCRTGAFSPLFCDTGLATPPGLNTTQILYENQETTSIALYSQVDWTFTDAWTLTVGARATQETKDFQAGQAYMSNIARQHLRNFPDYSNLDNTWNEVSPRLGLTYQISDSSLVYATYNRGFHSGGFFGVNQNTRDFERDQYEPEYANAYELGYKSTHLEDRLLLNVTLFRNDFEDKQESYIALDPDTATVKSVFANVADARYQGLELETQYVFADWFRAFLNYGYLDAEYSDFDIDLDQNGTIDDGSDLTPRNAPESTIGVGGTFNWPIGPGSLELYGKYAWIDEVEGDIFNAPTGKVDSRDDVTAAVSYIADKWTLSAFGKNLTDEEIEGVTNIGGLFATGTTNYPRTWGVELEYHFQP